MFCRFSLLIERLWIYHALLAQEAPSASALGLLRHGFSSASFHFLFFSYGLSF